ncbi:MAG: DUF3108 domain-containing protein [Cytophagaceae bacterium]|jgi:hypothetical protein|nr:DUF3108 domain-containing protein [Cytophagaceae bacterium]
MTKQIRYILLFLPILIIARAQLFAQDEIPFQPGEELTYTLSYGFIKGGGARLTVTDTVFNSQNVFHITAAGFTSGLVDAIFAIRDISESYVNPQTFFPVKTIRNIREGKYRFYDEVLFYHDADSTRINSHRSGKKCLPANMYDIVSAFYFGRYKYFNDSMVEGQVIRLLTYFGDEVFPLIIRYRGTEVIKTKFGKVECYKFSPVTEVGRAFKTNDDMHVWITRDKNRLPVKIKFELTVGSFVCDIESFKGLKNPFSSIKKK